MMRFLLLIATFVITLAPAFAADTQFRRLPVKEFVDKMKGAWLGQMIGVGWGAPTEFKVKGDIIPEAQMPPWKPEMVNQHNNDDCYVEMTFMRTLELYGLDASIRQAGIDFANSGYPLWCANKAGRENLRKGIAPPDSSHPKFSAHGDDIDYQIEADYSGIIAPGLPNLSIALGEKFGRLMNYGDGLYAGQFIGGMYAEAYFQSDPRRLIEAGLRCIPSESQYARMVRDLLAWSKENADWTKTWQLVEEKYHKDSRYSHGLSGKPGSKGDGSIDVKLNGAYVLMGLLYSQGDPDKTMIIACRCGQDSDCNPANAGGIFFAALGASKIPARFTEKLDLSRKFSFSDYTLPKVYEVSDKLARQAIARAGGRVEKDANGEEVFVIPVQTPKPSVLERSWEPGPIANSRFTPEEMAKIKGTFEYRKANRSQAASTKLLPEKVPCAVADKQDFQIPDRVQLTGWLGMRIAANEENRLAMIDTDRLLEGYRKRPGRQSWDGEHIGKWLHAATLAWVNTGDAALRAKLDEAVTELAKCQLADGYLGTYLDKNRWTSWDIWAHKYNLIGLVTYMRCTGNLAPLPTCRRMADLLCKTFGDAPGQRDIIPCGAHVGMAPTSVLEPMVLLYRLTGEPRYLDFCNYILRAWEQPNGPHIVSRLLELKRVDKVGNAKAYEMLSCLNGALELYRTTGDRKLLDACLNAWQDIVDHRLYLTGASSYGEHFHDDFDLPNVANVGETCVTVTWLQFNMQLLRLTGEARFADQLERVTLNQLLGAQKPDGTAWGYYVQMEGKKPYSATLDGHCCLSSGPRGIALLPTFAVTTDRDGAVINLFDAGTARLALHDGTPLTLNIETRYPADGRIRIVVEPATPKEFSVKLRIPAWCKQSSLKPSAGAKSGDDGYTALRRAWKSGDVIELNLKLESQIVTGDHLNQDKVAVLYGPLVLAADESLLANAKQPLNAFAIAKPDLAALAVTPEAAPADWQTWPGAQLFRVNAATRRGSTHFTARLVPFADAGATAARYKVWLPLAGQPSANVLLDGVESRSRQGNQNGSINDDDLQSCVVTFDGKPAKEDWFAVTLDAPAAIRRVAFVQGKTFHDGGWFVGPPKVQVQREKNGAWEMVGELSDYPATTATDNKKLKPGQTFTLRLPEPVRAVAIRVIGVPACGDNPKQAFASCGELQAFGE